MESNQPLDQDYGAQEGFSENFFRNLRTTGGWALFLAILGFISIGFLVITGFSISVLGGMAMQDFSSDFPFPFQLLGIFYLAIAAIYFFPVLYLYQFAQSARSTGQNRNMASVESMVAYLRKHYQYLGVMTLAMIVLYIAALIGLATMGVGFLG